MTDKEALFLVGRECPTTNRDVVKALSHLTKLAEENAALKAEADSWRILSETHEGCGEEWAGRALKAEAEVEKARKRASHFTHCPWCGRDLMPGRYCDCGLAYRERKGEGKNG